MNQNTKMMLRRGAVGLGVLALAGGLYLAVRWAGSGTASEAAGPDASSVLANGDDPPTLTAAIAAARPAMIDNPEGTSGGTLILVGWSTRHLRWSDVAVGRDETGAALVHKDVDAQRGKRLCVAGSIAELALVRTDSAQFNHGFLVDGAGQPFELFAIGGSGALAARDRARFCGVVTGLAQVSADMVGSARAVVLVGMLDVPENHPPQDPQDR